METIADLAIASLKEAGLGDVLYLPEQQLYDERVASYWSKPAQLKPRAIVQPRNMEEVSKALSALVKVNDCKIAVANYQVVLADGSIIEANKSKNSDLFFLLKGGGNNFGIITRFDVATFPSHDIWDGIITYSKSETDELVSAMVDFIKNLHGEPNDHLLAMWTYLPKTKDHIITAVLTNLDGVENAKSLDGFLSILCQKNMKTTTVATKLKDDTWFTLTFKLDPRLIKKVADAFEALTEEFKPLIPEQNFYVSMVLQPLLTSFAKHSVARDGNVLGLDRIKDDCVLMVIAIEIDTRTLTEIRVSEVESDG
ncbi:hypothetical protein PVAR5_7061 [Paecilomyces variotii No. 5]|uniref:FAD-binding PCMH-type domain-containing protein n=1 Tax=Byssochlamys spectabilis (strain No. 5 / NBRC 109023) TaxID=1356009 RepID=V5FKG3_BYSSN|nr:hypothetical protein PVAR5_7061 [Paecilomyces variotii No. 5]